MFQISVGVDISSEQPLVVASRAPARPRFEVPEHRRDEGGPSGRIVLPFGRRSTMKNWPFARHGEPEPRKEEPTRPAPAAPDLGALFHLDYWRGLRRGYVARREKEKRDLDVYEALSQGARSTVEYYVLIVLSCLIATAGLIQGSAAVIIGAMIIAPLMTPILAASLAIIWGDLVLLRTALFSIVKGVALAIVISALIAVAVPLPHLSAEIISRTRPSVFDIIVALAAGALAAYGYANRRVSNALVGIAIAVALMPPLCTIGIGVGRLDRSVALGASLLFAINLVAISLAGAIVFWLMKIHPVKAEGEEVKRRALWQIVLSGVVLAGLAVPVAFSMKTGYELDQAPGLIRRAVAEAMPDASVLVEGLRREGRGYRLDLTVGSPTEPGRAAVLRLESLIRASSPIIERIAVTSIETHSYSQRAAER